MQRRDVKSLPFSNGRTGGLHTGKAFISLSRLVWVLYMIQLLVQTGGQRICFAFRSATYASCRAILVAATEMLCWIKGTYTVMPTVCGCRLAVIDVCYSTEMVRVR